MKLYDSLGPNPQVVRMFIAEKGLDIPRVQVDIMGGENREGPYLARNPAGGLPCLELDDGTHISEVTAICEYIEETHPEPALIGSDPVMRAETRMWTRRIDLAICEPMANGFRFGEGHQMFKDRMRTVPEASDGLKSIAREKLAWLDGLMHGRSFICGERFSLADIHLYCFVAFGNSVGQPLDSSLAHLPAWFERVASRPSAAA